MHEQAWPSVGFFNGKQWLPLKTHRKMRFLHFVCNEGHGVVFISSFIANSAVL